MFTAAIAGLVSAALVSSALPRPIQLRLQPGVVEFGPTRVSVSGISSSTVSVRLRDADDPAGLAYRWVPYPWRALRLVRGRWTGVLPAPPLPGIYQLQLRLGRRRLLQSQHWLFRALPPRTLEGRSFPTPRAVIRNYVSSLPGRQSLVAVRPWRPARFDHRDPRLHRLFAIAYTPRGDNRPAMRLGAFITTVRSGYHGRWRLLEAGSTPYD